MRKRIAQVGTEEVHVQTETTQREIVQKTMVLSSSKFQKVVALPKVMDMSGESKLITRALDIVAEEIGLTASDFDPSSDFADLGVDSLLTLTIASRLREELEIDVPVDLFVECPTVKELTLFLGSEDSLSSAATSICRPTPETESEASGYETDQTDVDPDDINVIATIKCILAEEIGLPANELEGSRDFGELGLDSLMSLTVLARLREEIGLDLPGDLFGSNDCLDQVEAALGLKPKSTVIERVVLPAVDVLITKPVAFSVPTSSSLMLQGNPRVATKALFLFPDGSGSATSYAQLPPVSPDTVVYGLNCPYMLSPQDMKCSLEELTPSYLAEVRRRQPHGPYYLGGWSAGGICAFDAAQELERCGETVARLILIDSPFPIGLEKLPPRLYDFFSSIGMFGSVEGKAPPEWLIPHFLAFVDSLDMYRAKPFAPGQGPRTHIIWAKDGVCKNPGDPRPEPMFDDPREMNWLLNNRTDFGPNGWDALLGREDVVVETLENANHFTLMEGAKAVELASFLERAMH